MKTLAGRSCTFILISLLSLMGSTGLEGARFHRAPMSPDTNAEPPRHHHALPMNRRVRPDGSITYDNWSGYQVTGATGSVTDVKGSWKVPSVTCTPSNSTYSSAWVGIDMESSSLEQIGTEADCNSDGSGNYYAWYQFLPQDPVAIPIFVVQPGDLISAEVSFDIGSGLFTVKITDKPKVGQTQTYSTSEAVEGAPRSSAEWIVEAPSSNGCIDPLANFVKVNFTQDKATVAGHTGTIGSFATNAAITMIGDGKNCTPAGVVEAIPSLLSNNGAAFSVSFVDFEDLHSFGYGDSDGNHPLAGLTFDKAGKNLYGTTFWGLGDGIVFELRPSKSGWTESILHTFSGSGSDGQMPCASLIFDGAGNIYGTTRWGGASGLGTVFELTPSKHGWTETILHSFSGNDGQNPCTSLTFDQGGNIYGTTYSGGANGDGTVFELSPSQGVWTETVLHSFNGSDGQYAEAGLIFDNAGNLYGTTNSGGANGCGAVFELSPSKNGWVETVLYSFTYASGDGQYPYGNLIFDAAGNLYGTTASSLNGDGMVFELTPSNGNWAETVIHAFNTAGDGARPEAGLISDKAGNLYSTTAGGGANNYGTIFELTPSKGIWTEAVLHSFTGSDGSYPSAGLIIDNAGKLYGTTEEGGTTDYGVVFELTP